MIIYFNHFLQGLSVAIEALALVKDQQLDSKVHFIHAGGYDPQNPENVSHFEELQSLAARLNLVEGPEGDYQFIRDLSNEDKVFLLQKSDVNLYTPIGEHFGIVPLEAMAAGTPVIAMASGGPLETVKPDFTGFLIQEPFGKIEMAKAIEKFVVNPDLCKQLGKNGPSHVDDLFSFKAFSEKLDKIVQDLQ